MILLFPYKRFSFRTSLTMAQVTELLNKAVCPRKKSHRIGNPEGYVGKIRGNYFTIRRDPGYPKLIRYFLTTSNTFRAVILGELRPLPYGTDIEIILRLHLLVLGFMIFACGTALAMAVRSLVQSPTEGGEWITPLVGLLLVGAFYAAGLWDFARDARQAERFLDDLFARHLRHKTVLDS